ncbi:tRNA lysidine(34) synthetase TilS [Marinilactibacillus sp. GCM10026970]|uniref:tRNA lysidine(34) synthetase TilS n=1 Tax=Marinilactibacillus sp. GCM10026970 TaxID=3252642 RepID=UPI00361EC36F
MQLAERFAERVIRQSYFSKDDQVLLAVSGGVDSMVLLNLMLQLPTKCRPHISVAHLNHQLRAASEKEQKAVEQICKQHKLPLYTQKWAKQIHPKSGLEAAARNQRYAFFLDIMVQNDLNKLVTAHHRGDQAETILMKLVRGSSLEHLSGIKPVRDFHGRKVIRPLLEFSKKDLYEYAECVQLNYFEDETNQSLMYSRNRYRNQILPLMEKENEAVEAHLSNFAQEVNEIGSIALPIIEERTNQCAEYTENEIKLNRSKFLNEDRSMQKQILKQLLEKLYEQSESQYKQSHITLLIDWLKQKDPNSSFDLPGGYIAVREYEKILIRIPQKPLAILAEPLFINVGEWIELPGQKRLGLFRSDTCPTVESGVEQIALEMDSILLPLKVRHRETGDRIRVKGMDGSKKIKDLLIDRKIPMSQRNQLIILEDASGEIVWIVGLQESRLSIQPKPDRMHYVLLLEDYN